MGGISGGNMVRQRRKFKPRARTSRDLDLESIGPSNQQRIQPPIEEDGLWKIMPPLSTRLYEKSALGRRCDDGSIVLTASEVLFCHWHRHVPLPSENWLESEISNNPRLIYEAIIMDVGRNGGEMIVPSMHRPESGQLAWGIRWHRDRNHLNEKHQASVAIATTHDKLHWESLLTWCKNSMESNLDAELFVIDDELDVTMYKIDLIHPQGDLQSWSHLSTEEREEFLDNWKQRTPTESGSYVRHNAPWNWNQIGIEHMSGRVLRKEEDRYIQQILANEEEPTSDSLLMDDLLNRGLLLRPGFKYGCRWRVYDGDLNESHAPWLVQPMIESATTWEGVCLSVRLAEGVHKQWVCAINDGDNWKYLRIQRWLPGKNSSSDSN
tara:strand:+ start:954 stop:2093 length:1140 start_codon:yes stop_codon:yes gene_type:complete